MGRVAEISVGVGVVPVPFLQPDVAGVFPPSRVSVTMQAPPRLSPGMNRHLSEHWQASGKPTTGRRSTYTFPQPPTERDGTLALTVASGRFSNVNATRDGGVRERFPQEVRKIDPVAATIVPVTRDGLLVVGVVDTDKGGRIKTPGGFPEVHGDVTRIVTPRDLVEGRWSPSLTARREAREETGIRSGELGDVHATGAVHVDHPDANVWLVTHAGQTSLKASQISGRPTCGEFDAVGFIPDDPDVVADLLTHYYATLKTTKAALLLRGLGSYGRDWYEAMTSQLTSLAQQVASLSEQERAAVTADDRKYMHNNILVPA